MLATMYRITTIFARVCYGIMALYYSVICFLTFLDRDYILGGLLLCQTVLCLMLLANNIRAKYYQGHQLVIFVGTISLTTTIWRIILNLTLHRISTQAIATAICLDGFIMAILIYRYVLIGAILRQSSTDGGTTNDS